MIASEQYLLEVAQSLPECGLPRDKYLKHMEQSVEEYSTLHPLATLEDYRNYFGSLAEIAEGFDYYAGSRSPESVRDARIQRSLICRFAVAVCVLILVIITGLWLWGHGELGGPKTLSVFENGKVVRIFSSIDSSEAFADIIMQPNQWRNAS